MATLLCMLITTRGRVRKVVGLGQEEVIKEEGLAMVEAEGHRGSRVRGKKSSRVPLRKKCLTCL